MLKLHHRPRKARTHQRKQPIAEEEGGQLFLTRKLATAEEEGGHHFLLRKKPNETQRRPQNLHVGVAGPRDLLALSRKVQRRSEGTSSSQWQLKNGMFATSGREQERRHDCR